MSKVLVIAEHDGETLHAGTARVVSCALAIEPESLDVAVPGHDCAAVAQQAAGIAGVSRVLSLDRAENASPLAAVLAPQLAELAKRGYSHLLGPSTTFGKDLTPRIAALLGVPQVSDIMSVEGARRFQAAHLRGQRRADGGGAGGACGCRHRPSGFLAGRTGGRRGRHRGCRR